MSKWQCIEAVVRPFIELLAQFLQLRHQSRRQLASPLQQHRDESVQIKSTQECHWIMQKLGNDFWSMLAVKRRDHFHNIAQDLLYVDASGTIGSILYK